MTNEFKINEVVNNTEAYGTVVVKDIFTSVTNPEWFCYRVELQDDSAASYLCNEEELLSVNSEMSQEDLDRQAKN